MKHLKSVCCILALVLLLAATICTGGKNSKAKTITMKGGNDVKIQKNINLLKKKGGTLVLRKGTYKINKTVKVYSNIKIRATGKVKFKTSGTQSILSIQSAKNVSIKGIRFMTSTLGSSIKLIKSKGITIQDCTFDGGYTAISTCGVNTKKGKVQWQSGINIQKCNFRNITYCAVRGTALKSVNIKNNHIYQSNRLNRTTFGILLTGASSVQIADNKIGYCSYPIAFRTINYSWKDKKKTKKGTLKNSLSSYQKDLLNRNNVYQCDNQYAIYNNGTESRPAYYFNKKVKSLSISPGMTPYMNMFTNLSSYRGNTEDYYLFKSCMVQLEKAGGGTLYVNPGEYYISNAICVPSNVTIVFSSGAILKKQDAIYNTSLDNPKTMFILVPPSLAKQKGAIGGYNGTHDVKFIGASNVVMDCRYKTPGRAIDLGHCRNVTIKNIEFKNDYESHLIELNSSQNVLIEQCAFSGFKYNQEKMFRKEFINIDGSDANNNGFNHVWSNGDKTTCDNVTIQYCQFSNGGTGIGTHCYSADNNGQCYHTNVKIYNNTFEKMGYVGVWALNWKDADIKYNTFSEIGATSSTATYGSNYYGMYLQGVVNPTISGNLFRQCRIPFVFVQQTSRSSGGDLGEDISVVKYPDTISSLLSDYRSNTLERCTFNYYRVDSTSDKSTKTMTKINFD